MRFSPRFPKTIIYSFTFYREQLVSRSFGRLLTVASHITHRITRDILEVDVLLKAVPIPVKETTYWCHVQKLDDFIQQKHHIVQFEPLITNEDIVHHMEVFHCETDVGVEIPLYNGDCEQLPAAAKVCNRVISLWAMGASAFTYPKEAGLPIGGENYNPFIRLEVHFNNPELKTGKKTH